MIPTKARPYLIGFAVGFLGFVVFAASAVLDGQIDRIDQARKGTALERAEPYTIGSDRVTLQPLEPLPLTQKVTDSVKSEKAKISNVISTPQPTKPAVLVNAVQNGKSNNPASEIGSRPRRAGQLVEADLQGKPVLAQNRMTGVSSDAELAARATRNAMVKMGYRFGSTPADAVKHLQAVLKALGYYTGPNSGVFDARTRAAVAKFQQGLEGVKPFGFPNEKTVQAILISGPSSVPLE